jgi:WD40 repeat protein
MIVTILPLWWMVFIGKVLCEYATAAATTTTSAQLIHMELVLVNTLANNQSGNIRSLTWSSRSLLPTTTEGSTTPAVPYRYQLAAATSSTIQLWNSTTTTTTIPWTNDDTTTDAAAANNSIQQWEPVVDIFNAASVITNSSNGTIYAAPVHAISFSPNGKWLAVGKFWISDDVDLLSFLCRNVILNCETVNLVQNVIR